MRKSYGFELKKDLPAIPGKPKVCPKCDKWFMQQPRERICVGCRPKKLQAKMQHRRKVKSPGTTTRGRSVKSPNVQVRGRQNKRFEDIQKSRFGLPKPLIKEIKLAIRHEMIDYANDLLTMAEDTQANDLWSRLDQLKIIGMVFI
jgi:hypothetical protein